MQELLKKIEKKEAVFGVIGLGYVGLPLAVEFANAGMKVIGIDVDEERVAKINRAENFIQDVDADELAAAVKNGKLVATTDYSSLR
ncbi:MAG: UDP-N-acetyl-D-glucosamine dehydrogenase, partial [Candidatus Marinimicrobia bacterium]|nr:UDP-N-acetyl-D-glucosamine dehydrogenase [Candidatus Neomarinimicrobiota bacterium]